MDFFKNSNKEKIKKIEKAKRKDKAVKSIAERINFGGKFKKKKSKYKG